VGRLTVEQILNTLEGQFLFGKTYLSISTGLSKAEPIVHSTAPTFFGVMSEGGFVMAQMCLARLYDKHRGTVTIDLLLEKASVYPEEFPSASPMQVAKAVQDSRMKVSNLGSVLSAITHRRDTWFAHTDPRAVNDPATHQAKAELTVDQLQHAFAETESIIKEFGQLFNGSIGPICFLGQDDYENLFAVIRGATADEMRKFDESFEAQFGHPPPRPATLERVE
jgi:hypothetical protein